MADTTYNVRVKYDLDKTGAEGAASSLAKTFDRLAAAATAAFAVHKILDFGKRLVGLQAQAEEMRIGLATMLTGFNARGFTGAGGFEKAMSVSAGMMTQIRKDAAALPGTAEEFMTMMRAAIPGGLASGKAVMGPDSIYELAKKLTAAAHLLQIPGGASTVAREFQAMMEGRAIGRNDLFARIRGLMNDGKGMGAKEFNALSEPQRWEQTDKAIRKILDQSLPQYAKTWDAIGTTTANWVQQFARVATGPMFGMLERKLNQLNHWFQDNQAMIEKFLNDIGATAGSTLGHVFDSMRDAFAYVVENRDGLLTIAKAFGLLVVGGKFLGGNFGGGGAGNAIGGMFGGVGLNALTGGNSVTGMIMGLAGSLVAFGGAIGVAGAAIVALGAAANIAAEAIDKNHRTAINKDVENARLQDIIHGGAGAYAVAKQIIQENKLSVGGEIDPQRVQEYIKMNSSIDPKLGIWGASHRTAAQEVLDAFVDANERMNATITYGPAAPTEAEKLQQALYESNKQNIPRKADVNVTVNIKQDISQAEDPDRILVRTKQAIEDALIRPIESGNNRFAVLR